jgi:hypothetical protein
MDIFTLYKFALLILKLIIMSEKVYTATMNCTVDEPKKVISRGVEVAAKLYENTVDFSSPPETKVDFEKKLSDAQTAQANTEGGGLEETVLRDKFIAILFNVLMDILLPWVNGKYKGNQEKLLLSGFGVSLQPVKHDVPKTPVIDSIKQGKLTGSCKINLTKSTNPLQLRKEKLTYFIWLIDPEDVDKKTFLKSATNRYKLELFDLERGKELLIAVSVQNAAGMSSLSNIVSYFPN